MPKRKTSTLPTRIYTYGCRLPTEGVEIVEEQLRLAEVYRNRLIQIELRRRWKVRQAMLTAPDVAAAVSKVSELDKQIEAERVVIKAARAAARSKRPDVSAQRVRISELVADIKLARVALSEAKVGCKTPEIMAMIEAAQEEAYSSIRDAREVSGLYWGTYLLCEKAHEAICKEKSDPEPRHWNGCGRVGVQIQHGMLTPLVFGSDTRLRIEPLSKTGSKRSQTMSVVSIRVGSTELGKPIWARFPFRLHRSLPVDGKIMWAWIHKTKKGRWINWDLQLVIEAASFVRSERSIHDGGVVAIDLGWRKRLGGSSDTSAGLRVAYWHDDQGRHGELVVPAELQERLSHADSLRAIQDRNMDAAKAELGTWLKFNEEYLSVDTRGLFAGLSQWRSAIRLGAAVTEWEGMAGDRDAEICSHMSAWWKQHRHLYDWESCERDRTLNARKDLYRRWASEFTKWYAVVVLEDLDLRDLAEHPQPESLHKELHKSARHQRVQTAPSEFRLVLVSAAPGNGCAVAKVECDFTTMDCWVCTHRCIWDHMELRHKCPNCGRVWDQDYNAARNLLSRYAGGQSASDDVTPSALSSEEEVLMEPKMEVLENLTDSVVVVDCCERTVASPAQGGMP